LTSIRRLARYLARADVVRLHAHYPSPELSAVGLLAKLWRELLPELGDVSYMCPADH
jgi:hypothetical protein